MKTKKASALVFSLIMLSLMLAASLSVALVAVKDKKSSLATSKSTQAFQVADSGVEITLKQIYKGTGTYLDELGGGLSCDDNGDTLATVSGNIGSAEKSFQITFYKADGTLMTDCDTGKIEDINQLKSTGNYAGAARAVQMAVAAGGIETVHAYYQKERGSNTRVLRCVKGNCASAISTVENTSLDSNSIWTGSNFDGVKCNAGWTLSGCWIARDEDDSDMHPYENGCVTDDFDQGGTVELSILCFKQ